MYCFSFSFSFLEPSQGVRNELTTIYNCSGHEHRKNIEFQDYSHCTELSLKQTYRN